MSGNFESAFMKLLRAKQHWHDLCQRDEFFWKRHSKDELLLTKDPDGRYRIVLGLAYPSEYVSCIIGDIIHNLRSALDHVVVELIQLNGHRADRNSAFPIGSSNQHFLSAVVSKTRGASDKAISMIRSLEHEAIPPGVIWGIHTLDVTDKHKTILTMATLHSIKNLRVKYKSRSIRLPTLEIGHDAPSTPFRLPLPPDADESDISLSRSFEAHRSIVFGKGRPFEGQPIIHTLMQLIDHIEEIVGRFSNAFMRMMPFEGRL